MVPPPEDTLTSATQADPLNGQLTFGDMAVLVFAVLASLFAMVIALAT